MRINKVELKAIKFHEDMSEETNCYSANIYINGKKAGDIRNQGHGGESMLYIDPEYRASFNAWIQSQPDELFTSREYFEENDWVGQGKTYEEYMADYHKSGEELFDQVAMKQDEYNRTKRRGKKNIHFRLPDTPSNQWVYYKGLEYNEQNLEWLRNKEPELTEIFDPTAALDLGLVY
jgi:hypothetical protein